MTHRFHAICNVRNAIFGPTPGREQSSSTVFGRSESKSSRSLRAAFFRYLSKKIYISVSEKGGKKEQKRGDQVLKMQRTQSCVSQLESCFYLSKRFISAFQKRVGKETAEKRGPSVENATNPVLRLQKPTFAMASAIVSSSASIIP
jgi:hypothetical protein